ncbi:PP2C family serine/threonine-protein phosphatase [Marimonas sp. MJW-29]|uniref:PP2C family serine/threonine-protein phosphatase n=1 Tax=Sulfitobacter sediminis TaxID=3234186 RepID=A0ABV3RSX9_9RHOB
MRLDSATVVSQGRRNQQEDTIASDFPEGSDVGFVVLGDGMGGHACGEIASKLVVAGVFSAIKRQSENPDLLERRMGDILEDAAVEANARIGKYTHTRPETQGMGTTLLSPVIVRDKLYWISIGDSPLYIFRRNTLYRLNQTHTLQGQLDYLVRNNLLDPEEAKNCDPNSLTSAIAGYQIAQIDCCDSPVTLLDRDILIVASDGLQFLSDEEISQTVSRVQNEPASSIGNALMGQINALDHPDQDNVVCCIVKVEPNIDMSDLEVPMSVESGVVPTLGPGTGLVCREYAARQARNTGIA